MDSGFQRRKLPRFRITLHGAIYRWAQTIYHSGKRWFARSWTIYRRCWHNITGYNADVSFQTFFQGTYSIPSNQEVDQKCYFLAENNKTCFCEWNNFCLAWQMLESIKSTVVSDCFSSSASSAKNIWPTSIDDWLVLFRVHNKNQFYLKTFLNSMCSIICKEKQTLSSSLRNVLLWTITPWSNGWEFETKVWIVAFAFNPCIVLQDNVQRKENCHNDQLHYILFTLKRL